MKIRYFLSILVSLFLVIGCSNSEDDNQSQGEEPTIVPQVPETLDLNSAEQHMVEGNNNFAFNLFREVHDGHNSQILSPISITYALGMLNNGASGETLQQINKVLGFGETGAKGINDLCYKLLHNAPLLDKETKVMIANTIFMNKDYHIRPYFTETVKAFYGADPQTRDFHDGKTLDVINQWASDHTENMINKILSNSEFNPNAVSYLLNAIYFKGQWYHQFNPEITVDEEFEHIGYTKEQTLLPMMHQGAELLYMENNIFQAVQMPYGNDVYQMTILLPRKHNESDIQTGLDKVLQSLTADSWQETLQQLENTIVNLKLPRFETNTSIDLNEVMSKLGMPRAFNAQSAEFPLFCNIPTYISRMKQVAKINVNEHGTEASAVTVISTDGASYPGREIKYVEFIANRPFLYVISEQVTGTILFIGQFTGY